MTNNETKFEYTYSAKQQDEIEAIRKKYLPPEEDKMELLRKLDRQVESAGTMVGIIWGTIGALIFGIGMSMCMVWTNTLLLPGIIVGIIGMIPMILAYPMYKKVTKAKREEIAPQIIALTDELSKN